MSSAWCRVLSRFSRSKELIKLQQVVELAIDCFFVNKHIFLTTYSTKICFTAVTHCAHRTKALIWKALRATCKMYLLHGFMIVVVAGDHEFAWVSDLVVQLPTAPILDWVAASQHCGLIERNIRRRRFVLVTTVYPLKGCRALWLSTSWYCILCNL
jgi:hypothetical protein